MPASSLVLTYRDMIDHLVDWQGGSLADVDDRKIRRSIQEAYRQLSTDHRWSYYYTAGRINTVAPVTDGTVAYDLATNKVTLTGATWPSWVTLGKIKIGNVICPVYAQDSSTVIELDPNITFTADIAAGTTYELFRSAYALPVDFISIDEILQESSWWASTYVSPSDFLALERYGYSGIGTPQHWTIMGDPNNLSNLAIHFDPAPSTATTLDFIYYRRGRSLRYTGYETKETTGTIAYTSGGTTVTGTNTQFDSSMVGSILRSSDTTTPPTGLDGEYPYDSEKVIVAVASSTSLSVDSEFSTSRSGVWYNVSDPVDIDPVMIHPFRMCCISWLASMSKDADADRAEMKYRDALMRASGADARVKEKRVVGFNGLPRYRRLAYIPATSE